jgi:hypothetical protein
MIAPLQTALHVHGWNLASLLSGQGHGKDSKLQPGGCENQDEEEGPAPPRHGGPQQQRSQNGLAKAVFFNRLGGVRESDQLSRLSPP